MYLKIAYSFQKNLVRTQNKFGSSTVREPLVFETLKFYSIMKKKTTLVFPHPRQKLQLLA